MGSSKEKGVSVAANIVYNLSIYDLSEQTRLVWYSSEDDIKMCVMKGKDEDLCQNYIRVLALPTPGTLLGCGTNAFRPLCRVYGINGNSYSVESEKPGQAVCPYDPAHNSTAVYVDNELYSGTVADFSGLDPIIYREPLQTEQYDSLSLNAPNFVGSFTQGDFVYFFFRETAVEFINCGKAVFSRVARVCKWDKGGPHRFKNRWTTYLKSRLNCSMPGDFPFYFDEIRDYCPSIKCCTAERCPLTRSLRRPQAIRCAEDLTSCRAVVALRILPPATHPSSSTPAQSLPQASRERSRPKTSQRPAYPSLHDLRHRPAREKPHASTPA
ncbi:semaphorin [Culex quinquefasciatus]|uniref:Semaphorin n=1 Tax=Culex quinquefasciatus TaxID=7176 RepID=B0W2Z3_CULQU|nr:semaphorin [Culex quinquefasciatus]|eukprot:XP_001843077.1 semaphorin [Culex quinquefasciatus]